MKHFKLTIAIAALAAASCQTTTPPPAVTPPQPEAQHLLDPRTGWKGSTTDAISRRFDTAWHMVLAGDYVNARSRLQDIRMRDASYAPASLAEAAIEVGEGRLDTARPTVEQIIAKNPGYTAAEVYGAEIDVAENRIRSAFDRYRELSQRPDAPPGTASRYAELQTRVFDQLYGAAVNAQPEQAIALLREALQITPNATAARTLLVHDLIALKRYDEAKTELGPLLNTSAVDQAGVQESLAEIDVGHGQYEEAIARYERLVRRDPDGRYRLRLDQVKELFAAANMPPQFLRAMDAPAITRADLAVLMYWKIASIRFAQNVPAPPIAIDISETPGRDEIIRAIALGIFQIDPVTRRVNPDADITEAGLARVAARVLALRGAACARQVSGQEAILTACGITLVAGDLPVSGRAASAVLEQVDRAISR
ncbi:MAG: tetratricopeptide repeat protein [Acidobacteriota bacterium]|nr:tetratricopeptide repeat protein [Acidobacteriota bacterium]